MRTSFTEIVIPSDWQFSINPFDTDINLKPCKLKPFNLMTDESKKQLENSNGRRILKTCCVEEFFRRKIIRAENPR